MFYGQFSFNHIALGRITHSFLARIFDVARDYQLPYIVVDEVAGIPLEEKLREGR